MFFFFFLCAFHLYLFGFVCVFFDIVLQYKFFRSSHVCMCVCVISSMCIRRNQLSIAHFAVVVVVVIAVGSGGGGGGNSVAAMKF